MTLIGDVYRWLDSKFSSSPTNFSWVIKNQLAGSGLPLSFNQFKWLVNHGIGTIVTVPEISLPSQWFTAGDGESLQPHGNNVKIINYLHLRVEDYHAPTVEEIDSTVKFIENEIEAKRAGTSSLCRWERKNGNDIGCLLVKKRKY